VNAVWLIGAMVAANRGSNCCSLMRVMDGRILRCGIIRDHHSQGPLNLMMQFISVTLSQIFALFGALVTPKITERAKLYNLWWHLE